MTSEAAVRLLGAHDIQHLAASIGVKPTKKLGQNFMIDPGTVRRIARLSEVQPGDRVVEVGPGLGSLTLALLEAGARVTAVEIDPVLAQQLPRTLATYAPAAAADFSVITTDALKVTAADFRESGNATSDAQSGTDRDTSDTSGTASLDPAQPFALVSNLPYNVATPILLTFLERFSGLTSALVLVQNEVAERLTARPGSKIYGSPSVKLAWYGSAQKAGMVGRNVFWPVPNVDSSLVAFSRDAENTHPAALRELTFSIVDAAFAQRRKTLRAALKGLVSVEQIAAAGIEPTLRGEKLTIDDFLALAQQVAGSAGQTSRPKVVSGLSSPTVTETLLSGSQESNADSRPASTSASHSAAAGTAVHPSGTAATFIQLRTPAKINLALTAGPAAEEGGKRSLETVYCSVGLYDDVELTVKRPGAGFSLDLEGDNLGDLVLDSSDMRHNLAVRALFALAEEAGKAPDVGIRISKRIPVSAGLGSSSADAAAVLVGLNKLWHLDYSVARLREIGAKLRTEVAFCVTGGVLKGTGAGEIIAPLNHDDLGKISSMLTSSTVLLGTYHDGLLTSDVYAELDRQRAESSAEAPTAASDSTPAASSQASAQASGNHHNDLSAPVAALFPRAGAALDDALAAAPGVTAFISGSGPTVVACLPDAKAAWKVIGAWKASRNVDRIVRVEAPAEISISALD